MCATFGEVMVVYECASTPSDDIWQRHDCNEYMSCRIYVDISPIISWLFT